MAETKVDKTDTSETTDAPVVKKDINAVRYIGGNNVRSISPDQFAKGAGIDDQKEDVVWNEENDFTVPAAKFSANALEYLRSQSDEFALETK